MFKSALIGVGACLLWVEAAGETTAGRQPIHLGGPVQNIQLVDGSPRFTKR